MAVCATATAFLVFGGIPTIKVTDNLVLQGYGTQAEAVTVGTAMSYLKYARLGSSAGLAYELASFLKRNSDSYILLNWENDFWNWVDANKYLLDIGKSDCAPLARAGHWETYQWCLAKHHKDIVHEFLSEAKECEWEFFGIPARAMERQWEVKKTDSTKWVCYVYAFERWDGPGGSIFRESENYFDGGKWRNRFSTPISGPQ